LEEEYKQVEQLLWEAQEGLEVVEAYMSVVQAKALEQEVAQEAYMFAAQVRALVQPDVPQGLKYQFVPVESSC
jgi:hypothetical protein